jgi:pyruvate/2-oxoglutarate dehydrogenase complex dihydrolipoamide dehydrogenase (E3) component
MSQPEQFEVLILGSGQGGKLLAWHMARSGRRTAVVERRWIGGSCPNIACLPSKNEIWSARVAHLAHHAAKFGTSTGPVATDMAKVRQRKRDMVNREIDFHLQQYKTTGAELIMGTGHFVAPKTLEVRLNDGGTRELAGDQVFLNIGTHAAIPSVPGLEAARPLTHIEALELDDLPPHLIVLVGGYVGLELQRILSEEGIQILVAAEPLNVQGRSGEEVSVTVRTTSGEQKIEGSDILVAAGRIPNTAGIGLEKAGVELDGRGYIRVNEHLETTASGVWALGESAGSLQFTHVSVDDFRIIRDNLAGGKRSTRDRLVPYCLFTDPPLAHVGLSERDAQRQGVTVRVARLPMSAVLRTEATGETQGFMKALVGGSDDRILGFTMIGSEAGEVMVAVQMAILANLPYGRLRDAVLVHPTIAEGLGSLFSNVPPGSVQ